MFLPELTDRVRRLLRLKVAEERAVTLPPTDLPHGEETRPLTAEERAIAEWLLRNADPPAIDYLSQLDTTRVTGRCSCGCPTIDLSLPESTIRAEPRDNPVGDATAYVGTNLVGVMLLQRGGYLSCLEVYDLSDIPHPYSLPDPATLKPSPIPRPLPPFSVQS